MYLKMRGGRGSVGRDVEAKEGEVVGAFRLRKKLIVMLVLVLLASLKT